MALNVFEWIYQQNFVTDRHGRVAQGVFASAAITLMIFFIFSFVEDMFELQLSVTLKIHAILL